MFLQNAKGFEKIWKSGPLKLDVQNELVHFFEAALFLHNASARTSSKSAAETKV